MSSKPGLQKFKSNAKISLENSYEKEVIDNYEKMLTYLKYYRTFSQQETQFIDFVKKLNKLEAENKELKLKCAEYGRLLSTKKVFSPVVSLGIEFIRTLRAQSRTETRESNKERRSRRELIGIAIKLEQDSFRN